MSWNEPVYRKAANMGPELRAALDRLPPDERERFERLQSEARDIVRRYLTQEDYGFLYERNPGRNPDSMTKEERDRVASLMKKVDSMITADEKKKVAEANEWYWRLAGSGR